MPRHRLSREAFAHLAHNILSLPERDWLALLAMRPPKATDAADAGAPKRGRKPKAVEYPKGEA